MNTQPSNLSCSLDAAQQSQRLRDWEAVLAQAHQRRRLADGHQWLFSPDAVDLAEVASLVKAELTCCPFLSFTVAASAREVTLGIGAPGHPPKVLDGLITPPASAT